MNELLKEVEQMRSQIVEWRRHFHQNAELSFEEYKTSDFIEEKLRSFGGIEIERPTKTGVIGKIYGKGKGPTVARESRHRRASHDGGKRYSLCFREQAGYAFLRTRRTCGDATWHS